MKKKIWAWLILFALLALVPLVLPDPYYLEVVQWILFYAYLALAWNIVGGFAGQISLGQAAFVGIGAYTSTLLFIYLNLTPWVGMVAGGLVAALFSMIIGYPCFKLRGPYYVLVTLAFGEVVRKVFENVQKIGKVEIRGASGILLPLKESNWYNFQFDDKAPYYYFILIMTVVLVLVSYWIKGSRLGYWLEAIHNDEEAAMAVGVNTTRAKLIAAALSAFFCGIGGTFYAQALRYIDPTGVMGGALSIDMALIAITGGVGTVAGPVVGALLLRPLEEITRILLGGEVLGVHLMIYGALLIFVIIFMPKGLVVAVSNLWQKKQDKTAVVERGITP